VPWAFDNGSSRSIAEVIADSVTDKNKQTVLTLEYIGRLADILLDRCLYLAADD
jgi:hypothetical protein